MLSNEEGEAGHPPLSPFLEGDMEQSTAPNTKRQKVEALLASAALRKKQVVSSTSYIEDSQNLPKSGAAKAAYLDSLLNTSPLAGNPPIRSRNRKILAEPVSLAKGWYEVGWPTRKTYRVAELVQWWRILWRQKYGKDAPPYNWYLKQHLYQWLSADGYRRVEAVFDYAFRMWEVLKVRYNIEADEPHLALIYAYRRSIYREMVKTPAKSKTHIPVWVGENDHEYSEQPIIL